MRRIHGGAIILGLAVLLGGSAARAQETSGTITGRVIDKDSGQTLAGVTVIVQGPQGEDASLTDAHGNYYFSALPVGTYTIRFYMANSTSRTEQAGVIVTADRTVKVNARIAGQAAAAAAEQTYVINRKAPIVDIGTTRIGATFDSQYGADIPVGRNFGDIISKAPGAFVDRTGSVSIGGATGLENIYIVDGLNTTGAEYGNINTNNPSIGGGSNFPIEFMDQVSVNSGGYSAEYGGAMGGVINVVTKSGTNELHGSAFTYWSPYFLSGEANVVNRAGNSISTQRNPDYDTSVGAEVGGPILKNKLFFWVGFAPEFQQDHVYRFTNTLLQDTDGSLAFGRQVDQRRIDEPRKTYHYGMKLDFIPAPNHRLTLSLFGSPSSGTEMRSFSGDEAISDPAWARESVVRDTTDVTARWVSKLFDRKWQIEINTGVHQEHFSQSSPDAALNGLNQQEWWGANLWDLEHTPGCQPAPGSTFQPCPVNDYHNGGFGMVKTYDSSRFMGEIKSTHLFEALGHHELKYGWHLELTEFDQDRYYSGPLDSRGLVIHNQPSDPGFVDVYNFFSLHPGERPDQYASHPWDLTSTGAMTPDGRYVNNLPADVKSLSNAFFLQESYSILPNLTINAGARLEFQKLYDSHDANFLSLENLGPRLGLIYDPSKDGRSKIFVHYGRFFEAIPMDLAARYFGGEGIAVTRIDPSTCSNNPQTWTGNGEWRSCPPVQNVNNYYAANGGTDYPVQPHLRGQYNNEVVAGLQHELMEDMVASLDYTHRWLGAVIEDGTTDGSTYLLANPGNVPAEAIADYQRQVDRDQAAVNAAAPNSPAQAQAQSALAGSQALLSGLKGLAAEPKPERTYDALTLAINKRFSSHWMTHASYTYSRLIGNYEGLYQDHRDYFAPNGSAAYDIPDITLNQKGPLPNDRPHSVRIDGFYQQPVGKGSILAGLSFSARSGQPRNYVSALGIYGQYVDLLPRGSAGRTPTVTQCDLKVSYRRPVSANANLEAFLDIFNLFDQQTAIRLDDNYTYDSAAAIVNGSPADLKYAKNANTGAPLIQNPNFGRPTAYQTPIQGRMGMRLTF
jgi:hypothetical protein